MDDFNLEDVRIASPCKASWRKMKGDNRVRNCAKCSLNVYNISEMTREEVAQLITKTEGRLCIRLWRRRDGTVITKDCPIEFRQMRYLYAAVSSFLIGILLAMIQWSKLFPSEEMNRIERMKDLEAGGLVKASVIKVNKNLPVGYRVRNDDLDCLEISPREVPMGALWNWDLVLGKRLSRDIAADSILTEQDIIPDSDSIFRKYEQGIDLNLTPEELQQIDDIAKKKKTSVSKLMRAWILKKVKNYE